MDKESKTSSTSPIWISWPDFVITFEEVQITQIEKSAFHQFNGIRLRREDHSEKLVTSFTIKNQGPYTITLNFDQLKQNRLASGRKLHNESWEAFRLLIGRVHYREVDFVGCCFSRHTDLSHTIPDLLPGEYLALVRVYWKEEFVSLDRPVSFGVQGPGQVEILHHKAASEATHDKLCYLTWKSFSTRHALRMKNQGSEELGVDSIKVKKMFFDGRKQYGVVVHRYNHDSQQKTLNFEFLTTVEKSCEIISQKSEGVISAMSINPFENEVIIAVWDPRDGKMDFGYKPTHLFLKEEKFSFDYSDLNHLLEKNAKRMSIGISSDFEFEAIIEKLKFGQFLPTPTKTPENFRPEGEANVIENQNLKARFEEAGNVSKKNDPGEFKGNENDEENQKIEFSGENFEQRETFSENFGVSEIDENVNQFQESVSKVEAHGSGELDREQPSKKDPVPKFTMEYDHRELVQEMLRRNDLKTQKMMNETRYPTKSRSQRISNKLKRLSESSLKKLSLEGEDSERRRGRSFGPRLTSRTSTFHVKPNLDDSSESVMFEGAAPKKRLVIYPGQEQSAQPPLKTPSFSTRLNLNPDDPYMMKHFESFGTEKQQDSDRRNQNGGFLKGLEVPKTKPSKKFKKIGGPKPVIKSRGDLEEQPYFPPEIAPDPTNVLPFNSLSNITSQHNNEESSDFFQQRIQPGSGGGSGSSKNDNNSLSGAPFKSSPGEVRFRLREKEDFEEIPRPTKPILRIIKVDSVNYQKVKNFSKSNIELPQKKSNQNSKLALKKTESASLPLSNLQASLAPHKSNSIQEDYDPIRLGYSKSKNRLLMPTIAKGFNVISRISPSKLSRPRQTMTVPDNGRTVTEGNDLLSFGGSLKIGILHKSEIIQSYREHRPPETAGKGSGKSKIESARVGSNPFTKKKKRGKEVVLDKYRDLFDPVDDDGLMEGRFGSRGMHKFRSGDVARPSGSIKEESKDLDNSSKRGQESRKGELERVQTFGKHPNESSNPRNLKNKWSSDQTSKESRLTKNSQMKKNELKKRRIKKKSEDSRPQVSSGVSARVSILELPNESFLVNNNNNTSQKNPSSKNQGSRKGKALVLKNMPKRGSPKSKKIQKKSKVKKLGNRSGISNKGSREGKGVQVSSQRVSGVKPRKQNQAGQAKIGKFGRHPYNLMNSARTRRKPLQSQLGNKIKVVQGFKPKFSMGRSRIGSSRAIKIKKKKPKNNKDKTKEPSPKQSKQSRAPEEAFKVSAGSFLGQNFQKKNSPHRGRRSADYKGRASRLKKLRESLGLGPPETQKKGYIFGRSGISVSKNFDRKMTTESSLGPETSENRARRHRESLRTLGSKRVTLRREVGIRLQSPQKNNSHAIGNTSPRLRGLNAIKNQKPFKKYLKKMNSCLDSIPSPPPKQRYSNVFDTFRPSTTKRRNRFSYSTLEENPIEPLRMTQRFPSSISHQIPVRASFGSSQPKPPNLQGLRSARSSVSRVREVSNHSYKRVSHSPVLTSRLTPAMLVSETTVQTRNYLVEPLAYFN